MTTYKDIRGTHIKTVTTDPPAPVNGQMWYNSTTQVMKGFTSNPAGSWATLGNVNTARGGRPGGGGTKDAALMFGGEPGTAYVALTESWDGSSWTEVADMNTGRSNTYGAARTYTAALCIAGLNTSQPEYNLKVVENWNGSSWTEVADLNTQRYGLSAIGTNTAALAFGGAQFPTGPAPGRKTLTESWNGSAWTETADLNTARTGMAGLGATNTNGLGVGGYFTTVVSSNESWNGSAWTETTDLNTANQLQGAGGDYTAGLVYGGTPPVNARTEEWNGSSWTEKNDLNTARRDMASSVGGSTSATLGMAGSATGGPPYSAATEGWTAPITSTVTFTAS